MIKFNQPYTSGKEIIYIQDAINRGEFSGDGHYTKACSKFFFDKLNTPCFLTNSCTDALEMAAILANISAGDEVIMPSFTFVSTANAFLLRGASIKFVDSKSNSPNIDEDLIEELITLRTKAIVVVHYAGIACDMDKIMAIANKHNILVIEDAAHAIDSYYKNRPLGTIGHFGAFSFHATKNIIAGEGGMLCVNDPNKIKRAEIVREKGTNRTSFFRGEIDKYGWVDIGSSFLPSEITAAFLFAQLKSLDDIQQKRLAVWNAYYLALKEIEQYGFELPFLPEYATNNAHMFYLICPSLESRTKLIKYLSENKIKAVFHYQSLNESDFYKKLKTSSPSNQLVNSDKYSDRLIRLPLFPDLTNNQVKYISNHIIHFVNKN
jgi:dTDP-4-amino-4,6-dideoxygalactose transaminase